MKNDTYIQNVHSVFGNKIKHSYDYRKLQDRNNGAPLHIHTPRAARNRKEVQSIKSALSSIFRKQLKEETTYKSQVDIFRKHLKQEDIFRHST